MNKDENPNEKSIDEIMGKIYHIERKPRLKTKVFVLPILVIVLCSVIYFLSPKNNLPSAVTTSATITTYYPGGSYFEDYHNTDPVSNTTDGGLITIGFLYGNEYYSNSMKQTTETTIPQTTITHTTNDSDSYIMHYQLLKLSQDGNIEWYKTYDADTFSVDFIYINETPDGSFIAIGNKTKEVNNSYYDVPFIVKFDSNGEVMWEKEVDITHIALRKVIATTDGNYVLAGMVSNEATLIKIDDSGNLIWNKTYGHKESILNSVVETTDGNLMAVGYDNKNNTDSCNDQSVGYIIKVNNQGVKLWENSGYCSVVFETVSNIENNEYQVSGIKYNITTHINHVISISIDNNGTIMNSDTALDENDIIYQFNQEAFYSIENMNNVNPILKKYDSNNQLLWKLDFKNENIMTLNSIVKDAEGNIDIFFQTVKTIKTETYPLMLSVITLYQVDPDGNIVFQKEIGIK